MRKYEYEGKIESLKTLPSEVTLKEFELVSKSQEKYIGSFMYYLDTFEILGLSTEFIDAIDEDTLYELIGDFQKDFIVDKEDFTRSITVDGYTYSAFEEEFKLSGRDLADIEERMNKDPYGWITYALAILFKRDDLSTVEHKSAAHRKHKEKIFAEVTMDIALPYIMYLSESYVKNIKLLAEG